MLFLFLAFVFNIALAYATYVKLTDKGYSKTISIVLMLVAIWGGLLVFIIVLCLPETTNNEHAYYMQRGLYDWKCPKCGKINSTMYKVCECGMEKSENRNWKCKVCSKVNPIGVTICECGNRR